MSMRVCLSCGEALVFLLLVLTAGQAQEKEWDRRFGGSANDIAIGSVQINDGRYVFAGYSSSGISGDRTQSSLGGYDYWLLVADTAGLLLSDRRFGTSAHDYLSAVLYERKGTEDIIRVLGHTEAGQDNDKWQSSYGFLDFWGFRLYLNPTHSLSYNAIYYSRAVGGIYDEYASAMVLLPNGKVLNAGSSESPQNNVFPDAQRGSIDYVYYITDDEDDNRHLVNGIGKRYGGSGSDWLASGAAVRDSGGGLAGVILAGTSDSPISGDKSQASRGGNDYWVVRVDADGVKQWDRRFGGTGHDWCRVVRATPDGGFILGGLSASGAGGDKTQASRGGSDYWVVKIAANGNKQWDRRFGGSGSDELTDLILTSDGGYLLAGSSNSGANGDKTEASRGGFDYWIVKINSAGDKQWDRRYGGSGDDRLNAVLQTSDGGFLLTGYSSSGIGGDKSQASRGGQDYWIVKVSAEPPPPQPQPDLNKPHIDTIQPVAGTTVKRWSFMTAWNLHTGGFEASPQWYNGVYTWNHDATGYQEWLARFIYDQTSMQTRSLTWYYRQVHVQ